MKIDQISIEDAHFKNDLSLLDKLTDKTLIFGVLNVTKSRIETTEEIHIRLSEVLNHIDRDRLIVSPDCGLGLLSRMQAKQKLETMCKAVETL
jgi:5-methyltetrahydropteroyltriglutamate--homocysteine methyltransferase